MPHLPPVLSPSCQLLAAGIFTGTDIKHKTLTSHIHSLSFPRTISEVKNNLFIEETVFQAAILHFHDDSISHRCLPAPSIRSPLAFDFKPGYLVVTFFEFGCLHSQCLHFFLPRKYVDTLQNHDFFGGGIRDPPLKMYLLHFAPSGGPVAFVPCT